MIKTIEGFYQDGQIQLNELPQEVSGSIQVLVTFLDADNIDSVKLRQLIDRLETIAGIQQGLEEVNVDQTRPVGNFIQEMQQKYDILEDLQDLRIAKKEELENSSVSLEDVKKILNLS